MPMTVRGFLDGARISALEGREPFTFPEQLQTKTLSGRNVSIR